MNEERKPAVMLIISALIIIIGVALYSVFDSPKYNPLNTVFITSVSSSVSPTDTNVVNINTADVQELCSLHEIGKTKAEKIIEYREKNGAFRSVDELEYVDGISRKTIDANKGRIVV